MQQSLVQIRALAALLAMAASVWAAPEPVATCGQFALVEGGKPAAEIVRTGNAKVDADIAFFTNAVFRCTGASLPVVDVRKQGERAVRFEVAFGTAFDSDRHSISFPDAHTLVIGGTEDSCRWALNRILEKDFGVVFCFPGPHGTHHPRSTDVSVARTPFSGTASLAVERHLESEDPPWERCLGGRALGGPGQFYGHAMNRWLPPGEFRGTALAERIFPEKGGKRRDIPADAKTGWQPCFSSEESAVEAAKRICAWLGATPGARCCSISVNDLAGYCECKACERVNGGLAKKSRFHDYYDSFSEVYYTWANRVAERVAKTHPGVAIGLLAYCGTIDPPSFRLHPNLMPFLCTDVHQLMDDEAAKRRAALFSAWREKAVHIGNWGYDYGPPAYVLPRPYISCCRKFFDMKKAVCPSLDGYFGEGMNYVAEGPKRYMFYRMMFDVDCDDAAELKRWYAACCGEAAAPHLEAYYRTWEEFWTGPVARSCKAWYAGVKSTYFPFRNPSLYLPKWTPADMARATGLMDKVVAAAKASGDADQISRAEQLAEFHSYYVTRTRACGGDFSRIGSPATAVRFLEALPGICEAAKENVRIAEGIVRGKAYEKAYGYESRDYHLRGFVARSREPVNQAVVARLNEAVRFSVASPQVAAAIEKASRDERVVPELREMLSTLMRVSALPNLADGVEPEKSTKSFLWHFPKFEEGRDFFISFKITNRRVGKQGYWIYFAGKDTKSGRYRGGNEMMLSLGPGETRTVAFFSKTIKRTKGARLNVNAYPGELERPEDLEVADLRVCEVNHENVKDKETNR